MGQDHAERRAAKSRNPVQRKAAGQPRHSDLASIHIAKKALGWDEDTYRDVMLQVCGVRSAGALDDAGRSRFLAHLQACGAPVRASGRRPASASPRKPWNTQQKLVWSLWQQLADAGLARQRSRSAIDAWIKQHQVGVDRLEFCNAPQLHLVIEGLKAWLSRAPVATRNASQEA